MLRRGPLDGPGLAAGVAVRALPFAQRFLLRGEAATLGALRGAFGVAPPSAPLGSASEGARAALWLGPDEWLLIDDETDERLRDAIETALADVFHSLVDVSHRQTALALEGPRAAEALNFGCALDLDAAAFPVGRVVRTLFLKTEVTLWRRGEARWRVEVARSFAGYLTEALSEAVGALP